MDFCPYSQGWLYRKGYRFTLAEAQRSQRKRIKQYCLCIKHMSPLRSPRLCASARKQYVKPSTQAGFPLIRKSTTTVRSSLNYYTLSDSRALIAIVLHFLVLLEFLEFFRGKAQFYPRFRTISVYRYIINNLTALGIEHGQNLVVSA